MLCGRMDDGLTLIGPLAWGILGSLLTPFRSINMLWVYNGLALRRWPIRQMGVSGSLLTQFWHESRVVGLTEYAY